MKTLKIYLKHCPESSGTKIYCIKHDIDENLESLKEKIHLRVPQLRFAPVEPVIYWFDLENDKIRITCDDDLKFFMEESEIRKLTFEFMQFPQDSSRKRRSTLPIVYDVDDDDHSECSKRLRKIDLSSDSSMDTDSDEDVMQQGVTSSSSDILAPSTSQIVVDCVIQPSNKITVEHVAPSTSQTTVENATPSLADNVPAKVNIISIETIDAPAEDALNNNARDNEVVVIEPEQHSSGNNADSGNETSNEEQPPKERRRSSESNRIVISDSSEDEGDDSNGNDNHYSTRYRNNGGNNTYSYSFANAGIHGARMRSNENFRNLFSNVRDSQRRLFREQAFIRHNIRAAHENARDNVRAAHENARENIRQARATMENARRNVQSQMLQNFRAHFQPLFHPSVFYGYHRGSY